MFGYQIVQRISSTFSVIEQGGQIIGTEFFDFGFSSGLQIGEGIDLTVAKEQLTVVHLITNLQLFLLL